MESRTSDTLRKVSLIPKTLHVPRPMQRTSIVCSKQNMLTVYPGPIGAVD